MTPQIRICEDFTQNILSEFRRDEIGALCSSDPTIVNYGPSLYYKMKAKKDKKVEVKRTVMSDMRKLASILLAFS